MTDQAPLLERLLDFEAARHPPYRKATLIRTLFACSSPRYYQQLTAILTEPAALAAALAHDAETTNRLLRLRAARADAREARQPPPR